MNRSDGSRLGSYRIVRKLGEGSVGEVYQAIHEANQQIVALKFLFYWCRRDKELVQKFEKAALRLSRLNHPGIVRVLDFGAEPEGSPYFAMEFLEGETLAARLRRLGGALPISEALRIGQEMAAITCFVHQNKTLCQTFNPENWMLVQDPKAPARESVKLLDLFVAKLASQVDQNRMGMVTYTEHEEPTRFGGFFGPATYLSPELDRDTSDVSSRSDVYSLGVLLYQMLAGRVPFEAATQVEVIAMHMFAPPPPFTRPGLPAPLLALVNRMLAKEVADRPTLEQLVKELAHLSSEYGSSGPAE